MLQRLAEPLSSISNVDRDLPVSVRAFTSFLRKTINIRLMGTGGRCVWTGDQSRVYSSSHNGVVQNTVTLSSNFILSCLNLRYGPQLLV